MNISAKQVKDLRTKTGAGMMDCKKALQEADGDIDKAVELLRKKGQKLSAKRADREADQGLIMTKTGNDGKKAAALEINCETDFVARNEDFQNQADKFVSLAFKKEIDSVDKLLESELDGLTVADHLKEMVAKIGEKIKISRVVFMQTDGEIVSYIHPGNQLAVLVEFEDELSDSDIGNDVAMQIAAMNPLAVTEAGVDESLADKELEIAKTQLLNEGKPEEIVEKAAQGKLRRFYEERVLLNQKFVKDNSISVEVFLKEHKEPLVKSFKRLQLGESQ